MSVWNSQGSITPNSNCDTFVIDLKCQKHFPTQTLLLKWCWFLCQSWCSAGESFLEKCAAKAAKRIKNGQDRFKFIVYRRTFCEIYQSEALKDIQEFWCLCEASKLCSQSYMCEKNQCCLLLDGWKIWPKTLHTFSTSFCCSVCPVAHRVWNELHFIQCWSIIVPNHLFQI